MERKVIGASVQGSDHVLFSKNNQDSFEIAQKEGRFCGVVCDGCGEGKRSEVGASLTAAFVTRWLWHFGDSKLGLDQVMPHVLHNLKKFYEYLAASMTGSRDEPQPGEIALHKFGAEHLLCTVLGFYIRGDEGIVFALGDGTIVLGKEVISLAEENNAPVYPAYSIFSEALPKPRVIPFSVPDTSRLAVATDGVPASVLDEAFTCKSSLHLTRWMRVTQRQRRVFTDDATLTLINLNESAP